MTCIKGLKIAMGGCAAAALIATATGPGAQACGATAFMGGMGANLFPLTPALAELVSEDVQLTFADRQWHIDTSYEFRNNAPAETTIRLGFPEHRCDPEFTECEGGYAFDRMRVTVRGNAVELRREDPASKTATPEVRPVPTGPAYPPPSDEDEPIPEPAVWSVDVTFAPDEVVMIRHQYEVPTSGYYHDGSFSIDYVAGAHAQWEGLVDSAQFRIRLPADTSWVREDWIAAAGLTRASAQAVETEYGPLMEVAFGARSWQPGDVTFQFRQGHSRQTAHQGDSGSELWLDDLVKDGPVRAGYEDSARCPDFLDIWWLAASGIDWDDRALYLSTPAQYLADNSEPICTNQMFAVYGMRFQDDRLNRYFYGPDGWVPGTWPYGFMEPNPDFDIARLQAADWQAIDYFRRIELQASARASEPVKSARASWPGSRVSLTCLVWRRGDPWCGPRQTPR